MLLSFCIFYDIDIKQFTVQHLLAFVEFLAFSSLAYNTILNYCSGIKAKLQLFGLPVQPFEHKKYHLLLFSLSKNLPYNPKVKGVFDIDQLTRIIQLCETQPHSVVYKALFLTAFHAFLRLSNIAPEATHNFDVTRHLVRADLIYAPPGAHLMIKWSKTRQNLIKLQQCKYH